MTRLLAHGIRLSLILRHPSVHRPDQPLATAPLNNQAKVYHTEQCRAGLAT